MFRLFPARLHGGRSGTALYIQLPVNEHLKEHSERMFSMGHGHVIVKTFALPHALCASQVICRVYPPLRRRFYGRPRLHHALCTGATPK